MVRKDEKIIAWFSLSPFYGRLAYQHTAEITIYLTNSAQGMGLGSRIIEFCKQKIISLGFDTLVAFIFKGNQKSMHCFLKNDFELWGELPEVADMRTHKETLCILGYRHLNAL